MVELTVLCCPRLAVMYRNQLIWEYTTECDLSCSGSDETAANYWPLGVRRPIQLSRT